MYNSLLSASQVIYPLITFPYVARIIHPDGIGNATFVESICRYAILFAAIGIPIYGVREVAKCKKDQIKLNKLFSELIIIHVIITLFILLIYGFALFTIHRFQTHLSYYILGALMIFSNVFLVEWYFQGIEQFKFITLRNLVIRTVLTILVFILVKHKEDAIYYFAIIVLTSILNSIVNYWYAKSQIEFQYDIDYESLKLHFRPLFYIFGSIAFISVYTLLDTIMLGFLADEKAVGFYSAGLKISRVPILFIGALGVVLIPKLSEHYHQNNHDEFKRLISKSIYFVLTFSIPAIFLILGLSKELITVIAGREFFQSYLVLRILSVLGLFIGLSNVFGLQVLTPMSKDKYLTYSVLFGTLVSISLNLILIPLYKEIGAAISNIVAEIVVTSVSLYFANKFISFSFNFYFIIKILLISIPIVFIPQIMNNFTTNSYCVLITTIIIAAVYYIIMQLWVLKNEILLEIKNKLIEKLWTNTII